MLYKQGFAIPKQQSLQTTIIGAQMDLFDSKFLQAMNPLVSGMERIERGMNSIVQTTEQTKEIVQVTHSNVFEIKKTQEFRRVDITAETLELPIYCMDDAMEFAHVVN